MDHFATLKARRRSLRSIVFVKRLQAACRAGVNEIAATFSRDADAALAIEQANPPWQVLQQQQMVPKCGDGHDNRILRCR
jgi:hypothetical protein